MHAFRVGGSDRWEFLIAGDVCRQVAEAEAHAAKIETVVSPEAWRCSPLPNPNPSPNPNPKPNSPPPNPRPYPRPFAPILTFTITATPLHPALSTLVSAPPPPPNHPPRLVSAHYDGEPRGEGCMLLGSLSAGSLDPGEQGVSPSLADCLVSYELLQLQRKQQSQLLLNAPFHEAHIS